MTNPTAGDDKSKSRTGKKTTISKSAAERVPQKPAVKKSPQTTSSESARHPNATQVIITEDEYRALVAQKAHEIFRQRCAATEVDDWMQAERIVKEELLARGQTAGFV